MSSFAPTSPQGPRLARPQALKRVRELRDADEEAAKVWEIYCKVRGDGELDPDKHDDHFLVRFLDMQASEKPSEATVAQMIAMVQANPSVNDQWRRYCIEKGIGVADPRLLAKDFVTSFLDELERGKLDGGELIDPETAEKVVKLIKTDARAEELWKRYCIRQNDGETNPYLCGVDFVKRFLTVYAPDEPAAEELASLEKFLKAPFVKFQWGQYCLQEGLGVFEAETLPRYFVVKFLAACTGGQVKAAGRLAPKRLAEEAKQVSQSSPSNYQKWLEHCRTRGDGTLDPNLLSEDFVQFYLNSVVADQVA